MTTVSAHKSRNLYVRSVTCFILDLSSPDGLNMESNGSKNLHPPTLGQLWDFRRLFQKSDM